MMVIGEAPRMKTAFLFPGQGSQQVGMGRALFETAPAARAIFEQADSALQFGLSKLCFEGPEDELRLTANTQPAILAASIAALRALELRGALADFVAGHSLGEYSALVAAGSMKFEDAIKAVRRRGEFMQEAVPAGEGAMAALIGLQIEVVKALCEEASSLGVCAPANINSPNQTVIAGNKAAVERAVELVKAKGAKRAVMLPVSAPFHCQLMKPAAERMTAVLNEIDFKDLSVPLVTNVDATLITSGRQARESLLRQVVSPVRWSESVQVLINQGVGRFVEIGPGRVLSGLVRQISRDCQLSNVEDPESLDAAAASLEL
jgi:[acyl-carrier-protein] S-malonyltransferase